MSTSTTSTATTTKLLMNETKALDTFGIISPLVETSSSTTTIESTTAQISSKSSSPFNSLTFKDTKLSPSPEGAVAASPNIGSGSIGYSSNTVKSPVSPSNATGTLSDNPILPFLTEAFCKQQQSEERTSPMQNMLASTPTSNQQSSVTGSTGSISTTSVPSPTNSIKNIKCEPFGTLSPINENTNSQNLSEDNSSNNNNVGNNTPGNNNITTETALRERDGASSSSMHRQNSNSSINSCSATVNASSPNNGSDHSNSSNNSSSNISQSIESNADLLQDLNVETKTSNNKKKINITNMLIKDEENSRTSDKCSSSGGSAKNSSCSTPTMNTLTAIKEEQDVINALVNVKNEESTVSPDMSPVGFGSIGSVTNTINEVRTTSPVKMGDLTNITPGSNNSSNNNNNNNSEKISAILGTSGSCNEDNSTNIVNNSSTDITMVGNGTGSIGSVVGTGCEVNTPQQSSANPFNNNSSNVVVSLGNYMDYLQQQNHIFVFSTQLANKGAESVLSGQFPTIIAYHCTQPATKNFLEDFFIKNPMKMTKLQRQSSLNICGMPVGGPGNQQWMSGCNPMNQNPKMSQKSNIGKINLVSLKSSDTLPSESDLMCWEQTRSNLEGSTPDAHAIKMLDTVDLVMGAGQHNVGVNPHGAGKMLGPVDLGGDNTVPSLQGVKVPDENLTPQQRQHREEQLAKLKKMNQFLFPENGNDFRAEPGGPLQGNNQLNKIATDGVSGNMAGIMMNIPGTGPPIGPQIGPNTLNCAIRNLPANVINQNKMSVCNPDGMPNVIDEALVPADILGTHDMAGLPCNKGPCGPNIPINNQQNMPCGSGNVGNMPGNMNVNNLPTNAMACHGSGIIGPSGLIPNSPEIVGSFNPSCSGDGNLNNSGAKPMGPGNVMHPQDMNQVGVGMAQIEWSKLQHQFFEEKIKTKPGADIACMSNTLCRSNSTGINVNMRQIPSSGPCTSIATTGTNQTIKSTQGPPPPYHPTQRSASVPIATQSPNPASPNNPTSNLSLPSPRTSGAMGIPAHSPNMDVVHSSAMPTSTATTNITTTTTATTIGSTNANATNQGKNNYHPEIGSPTNNTCGGGNNANRNRNNFNQFNSNPSTPLSHLSPKELDNFNPSTGDLKNTRPSPQRSRTPLINHSNNNITETTNMEVRYPPASPGMNFPPHIQNLGNPSNVNPYKAPGAIERQNSTPVPSQFCRRTDNLPLNPNSNRPPHNKLNHSFDPISSLAQMSQQLTSCVSLNSNVGNNPGSIGVLSGNEMNMSNQSMEGMMSTIDGGMEHCGTGGNMGLSPHMGGTSPFMSNNCHINSMLGPMNQRLLNPKVCGGFNSTGGGGMRDGPGSFHGGAMPGHRMMGRMAVNFGNFNVSPNIQVKASTPNTIQYMPVRPQNNNNNMRVPPSLEFLQRYTNHQMSSGANVLDNGHMGSGPSSDPNKMNNPSNIVGGNSPINFFSNCNQMGPMGGPEQEDMNPSMMQSHDMNMGSPMMRGMRPIRHNMSHGGGNSVVPGPRMQAPGPTMVGPNVPQFPVAPQDSMECNDSTDIFGPSPNSGPQMYNSGQQKSIKTIGGMCQNIPNATSVGNSGQLPNQSLIQNEHNTGISTPVGPNGPVMLGNNSNIISNAMSVGGNNTSPVGCAGGGPGPGSGPAGNPNYKSFVGPSSNDLKYAQQYHSFQQQLYATSTRSQQVGGSNAINTNPAANAAFFVNK